MPYIVFIQIIGIPQTDQNWVQIDGYAADRINCRGLAQLVQTASDQTGQNNRMIIQNHESDVWLYCIGLEVDWIANRM